MLNKIRDFLTSASMPHGKQAAEDSLKAEAAKIRASWSTTAAATPSPPVTTGAYQSPYTTQVVQHGLAIQQAALQQQYAQMQAAQAHAGHIAAQNQINQVYQQGLGTLHTWDTTPPKYDPIWRMSYEAEREAASRAIMVEET